MCYLIGRSCSINATVAAANLILRCNGKEGTAHCQWAKNQIIREKDFIQTI